MVGFGFGGFLDACVQKANIWHRFDDRFTVDGQDESQYPMRAGVLWPHVDGHGVDALPILDRLAIFDGILCLYLLLFHVTFYSFLVPGSG
jgi:hypothetical protein